MFGESKNRLKTGSNLRRIRKAALEIGQIARGRINLDVAVRDLRSPLGGALCLRRPSRVDIRVL